MLLPPNEIHRFLLVVIPQQLEDPFQFTTTLLLNKVQSLIALNLYHLYLFVLLVVSQHYQLIKGQLYHDYKLYIVNHQGSLQLDLFWVEVVCSESRFLTEGGLLDDQWEGCQVSDYLFSPPPVLFVFIKLIIRFAVLQPLQHFCIFYLNGLILLSPNAFIEATVNSPIIILFSNPALAILSLILSLIHDASYLLKEHPILSLNLSESVLQLHFLLPSVEEWARCMDSWWQ